MKKLIISLVLMFIVCFTASVYAGTDLTFAWDQSTEAKGYHVYKSPTQTGFVKGVSPKVCTAVLEPLRTCTVVNVPDGLMWYAATAYDAAGNESEFSNAISFNGDTIPPVKPPNFKGTAVNVNVTITFGPTP